MRIASALCGAACVFMGAELVRSVIADDGDEEDDEYEDEDE